MSDMLNFINANDIEFYISQGKLLCLKYKGEDIGRVSVKRMFPFEFESEYIAVSNENYSRNDIENEIGIIRNLNSLSVNQKELLEDELRKRYFIPEITEVEFVKEEYGNVSFKVNTTSGKREFVITDMGSNIKKLGNERIMLTDVFGNRYYIKDINNLDDKTLRIIEIWI